MKERQFNCKIIGKTEATEGWLFKKQVYKIAVKFLEDDPKQTATFPLTFDQYCSLDVGDIITLTMYSDNGHTWSPYKKLYY
jgi:hypothetical protein